MGAILTQRENSRRKISVYITSDSLQHDKNVSVCNAFILG